MSFDRTTRARARSRAHASARYRPSRERAEKRGLVKKKARRIRDDHHRARCVERHTEREDGRSVQVAVVDKVDFPHAESAIRG